MSIVDVSYSDTDHIAYIQIYVQNNYCFRFVPAGTTIGSTTTCTPPAASYMMLNNTLISRFSTVITNRLLLPHRYSDDVIIIAYWYNVILICTWTTCIFYDCCEVRSNFPHELTRYMVLYLLFASVDFEFVVLQFLGQNTFCAPKILQ